MRFFRSAEAVDLLLEVNGIKTYYQTLEGFVKAVDNVSFRLSEGEALGLAGESACGKTTLALSIMKLLPPQGRIMAGEIFLDGEEIVRKKDSEMRKIRWKKLSMVFQSAMNALNPLFSIKDQIAEAILAPGNVSKKEAMKRTEKLIETVGLDTSRLNDYPHELSGGMKQRVLIAMALANYPRVLIADEPTSALDVIVQAQILKLIKDLQRGMKMSLILITHDLSVIAETCDRLAVIYAGKIVEYASVPTILKEPMHPYSKGIIESFSGLFSPRYEPLTFIPGAPPNLIDPPGGCRFHPRCPHAKEVCSTKEPQTVEIERGHTVACHLYSCRMGGY